MRLFVAIFLLFTALLFAQSEDSKNESFITEYEYGKLLYHNPRGIGCHNCHGKRGEGMVIAKYSHRGKERELIGPSVNNILYEKFKATLSKEGRVMPKYFLVEDEIKAIYYYLEESNKEKESKR